MTDQQPTIVPGGEKPSQEPPATPPPVEKKKRKTWGQMSWRERIGGLIVWGIVLVIGIGIYQAVSNSPASTSPARQPAAQVQEHKLGSGASVISFFGRSSSGEFTGEMNDLNTGEEQWLGNNADNSIAEAVGTAEAIDRVSMTVAVDADSAQEVGDHIGGMLGQLAPSARTWPASS